ncbi:MAG: DUF3734 domain-containing protein, partial [Cyanobacteria bacterium SZAS TMP-1]|nr:DUF3734 domain-containing protein [Cyanobacteria bacterium SZAS TMP-1]
KHRLRKELCRARAEKGVKSHSRACREDERNNKLDIVHVMYRSPAFEGVRRDTDFARRSIQRRMDSGFGDMHLAIAECHWASC